jgi:long-chain acyl-CoA synthetase
VHTAVQPLDWADATPEFSTELLEFCRARLARIKCPRSLEFIPELPRHETGKLYKRQLHDAYWK